MEFVVSCVHGHIAIHNAAARAALAAGTATIHSQHGHDRQAIVITQYSVAVASHSMLVAAAAPSPRIASTRLASPTVIV